MDKISGSPNAKDLYPPCVNIDVNSPEYSQRALPFLLEPMKSNFRAIFGFPVLQNIRWDELKNRVTVHEHEVLGVFLVFLKDKSYLPNFKQDDAKYDYFYKAIEDISSCVAESIEEQHEIFSRAGNRNLEDIWNSKSRSERYIYEIKIDRNEPDSLRHSKITIETLLSYIKSRLGSEYFSIRPNNKSLSSSFTLLVAPCQRLIDELKGSVHIQRRLESQVDKALSDYANPKNSQNEDGKNIYELISLEIKRSSFRRTGR